MTGEGLPTPREVPGTDEAALLSMFRALTDANRAALVATARALLDSQPPSPGERMHHPRPRRNQ